MSAEALMIKGRSQLLLDQPFFGALALKLKLVEDESIKTAATDAKHLIYSPPFVQKLTNMELRGLIAHEVMHCVLAHPMRRGQRDPELWNIACDIAANNHLIECGFILPQGAVVNASYGTNTPAETIYSDLLSKNKDDLPKPCSWGMVLDQGTGDIEASSMAGAESEWQIAVTQAAQVAKQQGKLPGNIEQFIQDIIDPKINWVTVLWPFFTSIVQNDYTWAKPNRAYISEDEYLPSMRSEGAGHFAIILDTSASLNDKELSEFFSEIAAIHRELQPELVTIIQCDTKVTDVKQIEQEDTFKTNDIQVLGRGGTRFSPAFQYINDNLHNVEAAVYLTDLECDDFGDAPSYPVLWVSTTNRTEAPFGRVIRM